MSKFSFPRLLDAVLGGCEQGIVLDSVGGQEVLADFKEIVNGLKEERWLDVSFGLVDDTGGAEAVAGKWPNRLGHQHPSCIIEDTETGDQIGLWFFDDLIHEKYVGRGIYSYKYFPSTIKSEWKIVEMTGHRYSLEDFTFDPNDVIKEEAGVQTSLDKRELEIDGKALELFDDSEENLVMADVEETSVINDARVWGDLDPKFLERKICLTTATSSKVRDKWIGQEWTVAELIGNLSTHAEGKKDGHCILQGTLASNVRSQKGVISQYLMILDLDTGDDMEKVLDWFLERNTFAIIWSTYSHLSVTTEVGKDAVFKRLPDGQEDVTDADVIEYLREHKKYQQDIIDSCKVDGLTHTENGQVYLVTHKAMPKFRILTVLDEPYVLVDQPGSSVDAIKFWKEKYLGMASMIGVHADRTGSDLSRLMYTPRHQAGQDFQIDVVAGEALKFDDIPRIDLRTGLKIGAAATFGAAADDVGGSGTTFKTKGLGRFLAQHSEDFMAVDWLDSVDPDGSRGSAAQGAGESFGCPLEHSHTPPADGAVDVGFFAVNGEEDNPFRLYCSHDNCPKDRGVLLDELCQVHGCTVSDLLKYCEGLNYDEVVRDDGSAEHDRQKGPEDKTAEDESDDPNIDTGNTYVGFYDYDSCRPDRGKKFSPPPSSLGETVVVKFDDVKWICFPNPDGAPVKLFTEIEHVGNITYDTGGRGMIFNVRKLDGDVVQINVDAKGGCLGADALAKEFSDARMSVRHGRNFMLKWVTESTELKQTTYLQDRPGWDADFQTYVCVGGQAISTRDRKYGLQSPPVDGRPGGTLEGWWDALDGFIDKEGTDQFKMGVLTAFVGPVLGLVPIVPGMCLFLSGTSTRGKSTAQKLGGSVWGSPKAGSCCVQNMLSTANALENRFEKSHHSYLALDETGTMAHFDDLQKTIFTAIGGKGKDRLNTKGVSLDPRKWSTVISISGETPLESHIRAKGGQMKEGIVARTIDLDVSDCAEIDQNTVSQILSINDHYGHAGPLFVKYLVEHRWNMDQATIARQVEAYALGLCGDDASPKDARIALLFGLIWWAGFHAVAAGALPAHFPVEDVVRRVWETQKTQRAVVGDGAAARAVTGIAAKLVATKGSKFVSLERYLEGEMPVNQEVLGYYQDASITGEGVIYLPKKTVEKLAEDSVSAMNVAKELRRMGLLIPCTERQMTHGHIPIVGVKIAHYRVKGEWLFGSDDDK